MYVEQVEKKYFSEMKGDVGMSLHEEGGNKMFRLRQEIIDNPIPTSLFCNGVATYL